MRVGSVRRGAVRHSKATGAGTRAGAKDAARVPSALRRRAKGRLTGESSRG